MSYLLWYLSGAITPVVIVVGVGVYRALRKNAQAGPNSVADVQENVVAIKTDDEGEKTVVQDANP